MAAFMFTAAASTILAPVAARLNVTLLVVLRVLVGAGSGVWFPGFHQLWSQWAPPLERSKLVGISYAGAQVGNIVALPVSSLLCSSAAGWPAIFYVFGGLGVLLSVAWFLLVSDTPSDHPRISSKELEYLTKELSGQVGAIIDRDITEENANCVLAALIQLENCHLN